MPALALNGADELGQMIADLVGAEAADQGEPARLIGRVQPVDELQQIPASATDRI